MKNYLKDSVHSLTAEEMKQINGGEKWKTHWSGTSNPLIYFGEACYNGVVLIHNAIFD
jgi:hypothetical protein